MLEANAEQMARYQETIAALEARLVGGGYPRNFESLIFVRNFTEDFCLSFLIHTAYLQTLIDLKTFKGMKTGLEKGNKDHFGVLFDFHV
jgi:hypothetical protein